MDNFKYKITYMTYVLCLRVRCNLYLGVMYLMPTVSEYYRRLQYKMEIIISKYLEREYST
jgi:hypothetical protein